MGENLASSVDAARLSKKLVTLKDDVPLKMNGLTALKYGGANKIRLYELYTELEFRQVDSEA